MIVRDSIPWVRIWPKVSKRLGMLFLIDLTIAVLYTFGGFTFLALSSLPLAMMGTALGVFLAFRTNSAYDRWWEARTLWGALVNYSRTFARQVLTLTQAKDPADTEELEDFARRMVMMEIAFVCALRCHLRVQNPFPELQSLLSVEDIAWLRRHRNVPAAILLRMGEELRAAHQQGWVDSYRWVAIDGSLEELTNIQGGCERIKNTPLPRQYDYFPRLLVGFFCALVPLGLVEGLGMLTPIASTLVSFIFVALDSIGRDIENPFENTVHDTPMTNLSRTIEIDLRQHIGQQRLPAMPGSVRGFAY